MTLRLESFYNMSYGHTIKRAIPKKQAPNPSSGEYPLKAAIYVRVSTADQQTCVGIALFLLIAWARTSHSIVPKGKRAEENVK